MLIVTAILFGQFAYRFYPTLYRQPDAASEQRLYRRSARYCGNRRLIRHEPAADAALLLLWFTSVSGRFDFKQLPIRFNLGVCFGRL